MTIQQFRKRPVTIAAVQWTGDNFAELVEFTGHHFEFDPDPALGDDGAQVFDKLHSTWVTVYVGQWVLKGVKGEFYPCDAEVLTETYEPVAPGGGFPDREIAPELIAALTELGNTYGPLGVALSAATLTNVAILREQLEPGYAPTVAESEDPPIEPAPDPGAATVYRERAALVAFLAAVYRSAIAYNDPSASGWPVIYIDTPQGQMSWHLNEADLDLFDHVPKVADDDAIAMWDGHTTEEKYERLAAAVKAIDTDARSPLQP